MGRIVIACFRPLPGKQAELRALTETHVQRLRDLGLATSRPGIAMEAENGDVVEVFEWVSDEAIASAHEHLVLLGVLLVASELLVLGLLQGPDKHAL